MGNISITHTETHDETKPAGSRARSLGDDDIREYKRAIRERLAIDHEFAANESGDPAIGIHKKVTMKALGAAPTTYNDVGYIYTKTVSGVIELFYKDSAGNEIQLTANGLIKDPVQAKQGDWIFSSVTTARIGWTNISSSYTNKFIRINGTPLSTGGADTHSHTLSEANLPAHTHTITATQTHGVDNLPTSTPHWSQDNGVESSTATASSSSVGSGTAFSANNVPAYVQAVLFQKD